MATINGLTTLAITDITSSDVFPIYDASTTTDKKAVLFATSTWTPVLTFGGASTGITYGTQSGKYFRIGLLMYVEFSIILTSKGSATGAAVITGLPYTSVSTASGMAVRFYSGMASIVGTPFGYIGSTTVGLAQMGSTAAANLTDANFGNTTRLDMWGMYYA